MTNSERLIREGITSLGFSFTAQQIQAFLIYLRELRKWNKACNLTGLKTEADIIVKHFLDSLLFLKVFPDHIRSTADIGSGAGFPGIPLKIICPDLKVYLVEPHKKKAVFLRHMVTVLGLQEAEIIEKRLEDVRDITVDIAVTRALFTVREMIEKTRGLIAAGGAIILNKGPKIQEELENISLQGIRVQQLTLPFLDIVRYLVVVPR